MPRGKRIERVYTGKAAKLDEKVKALEETLKAEREAAYKEQLKEERKAKKNQRVYALSGVFLSHKISSFPCPEYSFMAAMAWANISSLCA